MPRDRWVYITNTPTKHIHINQPNNRNAKTKNSLKNNNSDECLSKPQYITLYLKKKKKHFKEHKVNKKELITTLAALSTRRKHPTNQTDQWTHVLQNVVIFNQKTIKHKLDCQEHRQINIEQCLQLYLICTNPTHLHLNDGEWLM